MSRAALVVDDSRLIRRQVTRALIAFDFDVVEAKDGIEALSYLARSSGIELVVCDMNMPRMSGIELLRIMRQRISMSAIPFVMLTQDADDQRMREAMSLGATAWLPKPVHAETLRTLTDRITMHPAASS